MHPNPEVLALLALGEEDATEAERTHIAGCTVCSQEVAELAHLARVGRSASGSVLESPSPQVWERIRSELGFSEPANGRSAGATVTELDSRARRPAASPGPAPAGSRSRRLTALALAAVLALVVGFGAGLGWYRLRQPQPTVIAQAQLAPLPAWTGSSGHARVETYPDGTRELMVQLSTDKPLTGSQQVWLYDPTAKTMVPMGWLQSKTAQGHWAIPTTVDLQRYNVVDVSEEPAHDTDAAHSGNTIVRGTLAF